MKLFDTSRLERWVKKQPFFVKLLSILLGALIVAAYIIQLIGGWGDFVSTIEDDATAEVNHQTISVNRAEGINSDCSPIILDSDVEISEFNCNRIFTLEETVENPHPQDFITQDVYYFVEGDFGDIKDELKATVDGQTYLLIDRTEGTCLDVIAHHDFDQNGTTDALIQLHPGCGNGSALSYAFYSYLGEGFFQRSEPFGYTYLGNPEVERWRGEWSVVVESYNEGFNNLPAKTIQERYLLDSGVAQLVERSEIAELETIVELRVEEIESFFEQEGPFILEFDLDRDGSQDTIFATPLHRWGRLLWNVEFSNGTLAKQHSGINCKRIGILETTTLGYHDIVCDQNDVIIWDGSDYVPKISQE